MFSLTCILYNVLKWATAWLRWMHINFVRVALGQAKMAKLTDIVVLYKSEHFVVINKREDVKVNSNNLADRVTVETQLKNLYPQCVDPSAGHSFRFVHRLDYATSGILCVALNKEGARWGNKAFHERTVTKHYIALLRGHVDPIKYNHFVMDIGIGIDSSVTDIRKMCVASHPACTSSRNAKTTFVLLQHGFYEDDPASKVLLIPHTGRTHQLRVHCAHIGHLIVGDYTYSNREDVKPYRMMLHAHRLVIPMLKEPIDLTASSPFEPEVDPLWKPTSTFLTYEEFLEKHPLT